MLNQRINNLLIALAVAVLFAGCVPEDTVRWSSDGSVGVYSIDHKLGLIDGQGDPVLQIDEGDIHYTPDISPDGQTVCYAKMQHYTDYAEAKAQLSTAMLTALEQDAAAVFDRITTGDSLDQAVSGLIDTGDVYKKWLKKFVYEEYKATYSFPQSDETGKAKMELGLYELILCPASSPDAKEVLVKSFSPIGFIQFSPDGTLFGYAVCGEGYSLNEIYLIALNDTTRAVKVDDNTGVFFGWRADSAMVCYTQSNADLAESGDDNALIGLLCERNVLDAEGNLLAKQQDDGTVVCSGEKKDEQVGLLYDAFTKVQYSQGGRIFFSSGQVTLPISKLDEPQTRLFCYDSLTGVISDILSSKGLIFNGNDFNLFSISPDGTKILFPNGESGAVVYDLSKREFITTIGERVPDENDWPALVPAWKDNETISCAFVKGKNENNQTIYGQGIYNLKGELIKELNIEP